MGYASPSVKWGYTGYIASADVLASKATEITCTSTSTPVTVWSGHWLEDVHDRSTIRFKCELRKAGSGSAKLRIYLNGVLKYTVSESGVAYAAKSTDLTVNWDRGDLILITLVSTVAGATSYVKNQSWSGKQCPLIMG